MRSATTKLSLIAGTCVVTSALAACASRVMDLGGDASLGDGPSLGGDAGLDAVTEVGSFGDGMAGGGPCTNPLPTTCPMTTISGTVYDPATVNGLYHVLVYVPSSQLDAIPDGPTCTQCQAKASGCSIASAYTDATGKFVIKMDPDAGNNIPPVGTDIDLVLQLGKWRKHVKIPNVACNVDNPQPDKSLHLPTKQHEDSPDDNIPLIALTTGIDGAECFFLRRIGIDISEFTGSNGPGRVHVYKSANDYGQTFSGVSGGMTAQQLWVTQSEMMRHDIVFDACEGTVNDRGGAGSTNVAYTAYLNYLNAGGRTFASHFFYNFFASAAECTAGSTGNDPSNFAHPNTCQGQGSLPTTGQWGGNHSYVGGDSTHPYGGCPNTYPWTHGGSCMNIDTAIPKGQAFADWYANNNSKIGPNWGGENYGYVALGNFKDSIGTLEPTLLDAGTATPWLYIPQTYSTTFEPNYDAYYLSVNTPLGTDPATQCGRAVFTDVHIGEQPGRSAFPAYCSANPNTSDHAPNELALEFLFFDLSSCIGNDKGPPPPIH
jgi:hypothetical protein